MTFLAQLSPRHTFLALALSVTLATPALADPWRGGPGMGVDRPDCQYRNDLRQDMRDGDACPYMKQQIPPRAMQHPAMPAGGKVIGVMVSNLTNAVLDGAGPDSRCQRRACATRQRCSTSRHSCWRHDYRLCRQPGLFRRAPALAGAKGRSRQTAGNQIAARTPAGATQHQPAAARNQTGQR